MHECELYENKRMQQASIQAYMMTSSNGNISALLAICAGNSPVTGEFPAQRPVTRSFDVFFDLRLTRRSSKQSWGWRIETLPRPLWRHSSVVIIYCYLQYLFVLHKSSYFLKPVAVSI